MKSVLEVCVVALAMAFVAAAQDQSKPVLRPGIQVQMAVASHAVEMTAADKEDATVVSITADGRVFLGVKLVDVSALSSLGSATVYVKADARVPYQKLLAVLDALHGRPVVLLTAPANMEKGKLVPPYGLKVMLGGM